MIYRRLAIGALLIAIFGVPVATADPITYTINFTLTSGSPLPTAGSFTYDPSVAVNPFSNFDVVWNGLTFDLTASANNPFMSAPPNAPPCVGGNTGAAAAFDLMSGACAAAPFITWFALSGSVFGFSAPPAVNGEFIDIVAVMQTPGANATAKGEWTITPTPEPSYLIPGTLFLAFIGRKRIIQRLNTNRRN
jgi:hypothetical protein